MNLLPYSSNHLLTHCDTYSHTQVCPSSSLRPIKVDSCSASSQHSNPHDCTKAFDGSSTTEWATAGQGAGSWIKANFLATVTRFTYKQRAARTSGRNRGIRVEFSDGYTQKYTLQDTSAVQTFTLSRPVSTAFVEIVVEDVHYKNNNGAAEIAFFRCCHAEADYTATMYERGVTPGASQLHLKATYCANNHNNKYVFAFYQGGRYKMVATTAEKLKTNAALNSGVEARYVSTTTAINIQDKATLCRLWTGQGHQLTHVNGQYLLKDIKVSTCGACIYIYVLLHILVCIVCSDIPYVCDGSRSFAW